ncbi:hypothetical protein IFO70_10085 [Phormidium tenue FACHB-886]|nr:hypothetical protein [Phormidium tenue FACHB-886]
MARKIYTLEAVNDRLRASHIGVEVLQRGRKLSLRATLPPKPGSDKSKPHQQIISTGKYSTPEGLEEAEAIAMELRSQLQRGRFSWEAWSEESAPVDRESCGSVIARYKPYCLKQIIKKSGEEGERVWHKQFWLYLKHLPAESKLTPEMLIRVAENSTEENTRSRQICCQEFKRLAEFAGVAIDFSSYTGNYSPKSAKREIPSDEEIAEAIDQMKNLKWRWIAGMMATFGLRDHECWLCSVTWQQSDQSPVLAVRVEDETKTGEREVLPFHPEWVERWQLWDVQRPDVTAKWLKDYSDRTCKAFKRLKVGFTPYTLRHAWCIRASVFYKLPLPVASAMAGHSPAVHLATYNRWISAAQYHSAYSEAIAQVRRGI